jgi:hypothetical protein
MVCVKKTNPVLYAWLLYREMICDGVKLLNRFIYLLYVLLDKTTNENLCYVIGGTQ